MTGSSRISSGKARPRGDQLRLLASGLIIVTILFLWFAGGHYLLSKYRIGPSDDRSEPAFLAWMGAFATAVTYTLLCIFVGRNKVNQAFTKITNFVFGVSEKNED
jgi:hypothetical protein